MKCWTSQFLNKRFVDHTWRIWCSICLVSLQNVNEVSKMLGQVDNFFHCSNYGKVSEVSEGINVSCVIIFIITANDYKYSIIFKYDIWFNSPVFIQQNSIIFALILIEKVVAWSFYKKKLLEKFTLPHIQMSLSEE